MLPAALDLQRTCQIHGAVEAFHEHILAYWQMEIQESNTPLSVHGEEGLYRGA